MGQTQQAMGSNPQALAQQMGMLNQLQPQQANRMLQMPFQPNINSPDFRAQTAAMKAAQGNQTGQWNAMPGGGMQFQPMDYSQMPGQTQGPASLGGAYGPTPKRTQASLAQRPDPLTWAGGLGGGPQPGLQGGRSGGPRQELAGTPTPTSSTGMRTPSTGAPAAGAGGKAGAGPQQKQMAQQISALPGGPPQRMPRQPMPPGAPAQGAGGKTR